MTKKLSDIVITSALRTPIGTYRGRLKELNADKLGSISIKEVIKNSKLKGNDIDEVIMGQVLTSTIGQNPARQESMSKAPHVIFYREEKKLSETNNSFFLNFYEAKFFVSKTLRPNLVYY